MRLQLWSYNYDPEPTGIAPLSRVWALEMARRGHDVTVVAAHPHYPEPLWGGAWRPYREVRDGIPVWRLPIWPGRQSLKERLRQEATFAAALGLTAPFLGRPDAIVAVSPSFPALAIAQAASRVRGVPWYLWLQDILPDGATNTGLLDEGRTLQLARALESRAYRSASRIVVIGDSFSRNLAAKGVPDPRLVRAYNPASRPIRGTPRPESAIDPALALSMGNIGHSQNLEAITRAFEAHEGLTGLGARFVMAGDGIAGDAVRAAIASTRTQVTGIVDSATLEELLLSASVGVVTQSFEGDDFNVPSKLMNFLAYGVPVVAAVRRDSEVARIIERAGAGWVADTPETWAAALEGALQDARELRRRGESGRRWAQQNVDPRCLGEVFEGVLQGGGR